MTTYRGIFVDGGLSVHSWKANGTLRPFARRLLELQRAHPSATVGVAWDCDRSESWRRKRSAAYKANREPMPPAFTSALQALRADLPALDVLQFSSPGAEADDVLFSLSVTRPGPSLIVTGDKDMVQAIRPGVDLLRTAHDRHGTDQLLTAETLPSATVKLAGKPITGLDAAGWSSLLALCGDSVDGIKGLPRVGPVMALELLRACPGFVELLCSWCPGCSGQGWWEERVGESGEHEDDCVQVLCDSCRGSCLDEAKLDEARRACNAASATLARWVERAIDHLAELRLSRELVRLRLVEVECVDAEPDTERAAQLIRAAGLEAA